MQLGLEKVAVNRKQKQEYKKENEWQAHDIDH